MSKEIGRDFVPEIGKSLDDQIITNGLEAAQVTLPNYHWEEIKDLLKTMSPPRRHAALVLRRKQKTRRIDVPRAAEMIMLTLDYAEELTIGATGKLKIVHFDQSFWNDNLNVDNLNNN